MSPAGNAQSTVSAFALFSLYNGPYIAARFTFTHLHLFGLLSSLSLLYTLEKMQLLSRRNVAVTLTSSALFVVSAAAGGSDSLYSTFQPRVGSSKAMLGPRGVTHWLHARADCTTATVVSGDSCGSLASKCGISGDDFTKYNPSSTLCSTLQVGQRVCCSPGDLPDLTPKSNSDGTCASYVVQAGDDCSKIAAAHSLTVDKLDSFNNQTWGWTGCKNLQSGVNMCLSTGRPPMPAPLDNAVCGPQVPGTKPPTGDEKLADLNPCPLNACCDIWGQCGTTDEYCTPSDSTTRAPGTAAPGTNGCISNCGAAIVNNDEKPATFNHIAYFEAWNQDRPCLNMDINDIKTDSYSHVHFAFANITANDFQVDVANVQDQFDKLVALQGIKRILSFGGWSFSTSQDSFPIFRQSVTTANRQTFASNVVSFVKQHNLDGVDFDWEYPGAPDIPGIPAGSKDDGKNYLEFLKMVREGLPSDKSLSVAAPASFWYLKGFPIKDIAEVVDYIIYMTYDLHGQWDYGSKWSSPGCPSGNCLRSHINITETTNALSMVTKAGVPAKKIMVGITSYGRAFKMTTAGCTGEMCTFVGPESAAAPGECTATAGYISDAEIKDIISGGGNIQQWRDSSLSNILVYNDTEWVAWMDDDNKKSRISLYEAWNFGGVTDWAVDLQDYVAGEAVEPWQPVKCDGQFKSLDDLLAASNIPEMCMNIYLMQVLSGTLKGALDSYQDLLNSDYDHDFDLYSQQVKAVAPDQLKDFMNKHMNDYFTCIVSKGDSKGYTNVTWKSCPGDTDHPFSVYWEPKDVDGFFTELEKSTGIDRTWVKFGDYHYWDLCIPPQDCSAFGWYHGYPMLTDFTVPNPKDTISKALPSLQDLGESLLDTAAEAAAFIYDGAYSDVVDGSSLLVFMIDSSVKSMAEIKKIGDKIEEEKRKQFILFFLTFLLMIIPGVGEVAAAAELANVARIIAMLGEAGNAALSIYEIVENPSSAPLAIFGILLGAGGLVRGPKAFGDAAAARRAMAAGDVAKLGDNVKMGMDKIGKAIKACY